MSPHDLLMFGSLIGRCSCVMRRTVLNVAGASVVGDRDIDIVSVWASSE